MINRVSAIHKSLEKSSVVLRHLMDTGLFVNEEKAFSVFRATLKALRDRLEVHEAINLGAQLPALLRGFYYEGWNLRSTSKTRTRAGFLQLVRERLRGHDDVNIEEATQACLKIVLDMIDQGEAVEILHQLPRGIQDLCPE